MKHANVSIFVPHLGCPNDCSFCNQRHITGKSNAPSASDIDEAVSIAVSSKNYSPNSTEIAFFGGSFTAIERCYMLGLLKTAYKYVQNDSVKGIRISTRPDCIDDEVLDILKKFGVTAIELGAQSMDDNVLIANNRGHLSQDVVSASELIRDFGFELGLQMMTGLYTDTDEGAIQTAKKIIELKPDTVRIYPTVVLKNTHLSELVQKGIYSPQRLESAVSLCVRLSDMFDSAGIKVIRCGLHSIDEGAFVAGPWHPAFSELCETEKIYRKIVKSCNKDLKYEIHVNPADISKALGQKRTNAERLIREGYNVSFIQNTLIERNQIIIKEVK